MCRVSCATNALLLRCHTYCGQLLAEAETCHLLSPFNCKDVPWFPYHTDESQVQIDNLPSAFGKREELSSTEYKKVAVLISGTGKVYIAVSYV